MTDVLPGLRTATLENGLRIVTERNPSQRSASLSWFIPGGTAQDPIERGDGWATLLSEYLLRGAGEHDSRGFSDALDRLGARRSVVANTYHHRLSATVPGKHLTALLDLMADLILRPAFPDAALDSVKSLCLQELEGLEDDPAHLAAIRLDEIRYPPPFDRHGLGVAAHLRDADRGSLAAHWNRIARPGGAILAIAGDVDHDRVVEHLAASLEPWRGEGFVPEPSGPARGGICRTERETAQVHLGIGLPGPIARDPDTLPFRIAVGVLGGGTSSRLWLEVRERRGLAYSIGARFDEGYAIGGVTIVGGTTPERVGETIEQIDSVLEGFASGPEKDEVVRVVRGLRAGGLMQMEQGPTRARQIALDVFRRGAARTIEEILSAYEDVGFDDVVRVVETRMGPSWRSDAVRSVLGPGSTTSAIS